MSKLLLEQIQKTYRNGEVVHALKGVSVGFRAHEFVSILGPSGCGKTTMLNIIGGLDQYDGGTLTLDGVSTSQFKSADWDAYRNRCIGFVFQTYNLISHQTVLQNVEIAMTLSGVNANERRRRAKEALASVGLTSQEKKKPNQLSGGQMQRVAIARALVNNPDILLADEPTGALDSQTSVQIMEILKKISKTKLVIMVTHNAELAADYSTRIIQMLDGQLKSDSNPIREDENPQNAALGSLKPKPIKKTSMSLPSASLLSFKNLLSKKGRTFITSFAGSIGIIGVALVLALANGMSNFIDKMQSETLASFPITIGQTATYDTNIFQSRTNDMLGRMNTDNVKFTEEKVIFPYDTKGNTRKHTNILTPEYFDYINAMQEKFPDTVKSITYTQGVQMNLLAKGNEGVVKFDTEEQPKNPEEHSPEEGQLFWGELPKDEGFVLSVYDIIGEGSRLPTQKNEIAIVVDEYNRIDTKFFEKIGLYSLEENYDFSEFIGQSLLKIVPNDSFYTLSSGDLFLPASPSEYETLFNSQDGLELTITGILRIKESSLAMRGYLSTGLVYTSGLTEYVMDSAGKSQITSAQKEAETDVISGQPFASETARKDSLIRLGADTTPISISIYTEIEGKEAIKDYLDSYNLDKSEDDRIIYEDIAEMLASTLSVMLDTLSIILVGFAAVSLVVSTMMIAIITYVSVLERTKEIGILRSVGARKRDISRVFNAEAMLIGLAAGVLGVGLSYAASIPINSIVFNMTGVTNISSLPILYGVALVGGSIILTLIAGFIPAIMAARKDPVEALRTE